MFGSNESSSASNQQSAISGGGVFAPSNNIGIGGGLISLNTTFEKLSAVFLVAVGVVAWRKFKA